VTFSLKWLHHRRGVAIVGVAAVLTGGLGMAPAVSSTLAPQSGTSHVFYGCLATSGDREVFKVVKSPARPRRCPAGTMRVHWNAKGKPGANGVNGAPGSAGVNGTNGVDGSTGLTGAAGADGTNGADGLDGSTGLTGTAGADGTIGADGTDGSTGAAGADGTNGADGSTGPAGPAGHGNMMSGGVFILQSPGQWADTHAYLPLSGYLGTEVEAPWLDYDAYVIEAEHTSVEQVIPNDVTITDMYANFGSITDLSGRSFQVRLTLLVASPGAPVLVPAGGCLFDVEGNGPTSNDCSWQEDQAVHLRAGDVAVVYVDVSLHGTWDPDSIDVYGSVALTS
jgi:Collagen triple helix repeat (20 copies)